MLFWRTMIFWTFMLVRRSSQGSADFDFGSLIHLPIYHKGGRKEENAPREMTRPKQQVCNSAGTKNAHCYCGHGYGWPPTACKANPACSRTPAVSEESCHCAAQPLPLRTYCQLQPTDIPFTYVIKMSVRLDKPFEIALWDSTSPLFKKYKQDLEKAFTEGYTSLPGFRNVTVTGFRPGSTMVSYEITAAKNIPVENATQKVADALDPSYKLVPASFAKEILGEVNFSISPENIFEGDTVKMTCESALSSTNATWYLSGSVVSSSSRHSITAGFAAGKSTTTLKITSIKLNEAGDYSCTFLKKGIDLSSIYKAVGNITVSQIKVVPSDNVSIVCNGESKTLSCCTESNIQLFTSYWKSHGAINISGSTTSTHNCTTYLLQANESQCPADKSGTKTDYMCELNTTYGARSSKVISVTYFRLAKVTMSASRNGHVSEGHGFSLTCLSDVSNYDKVTWKIQRGNSTTHVDSIWYSTRKTLKGAESVLTGAAATRDWNGTYTCTFFQSFLNSSASMQFEVHPLPLKHEIIRDPIDASVPCPGTQVLKCCTSKLEHYTVSFYAPGWPSAIQAEKREEGSFNCYHQTLTVTEAYCDSTQQVSQVHCEFTNQIDVTVKSSPMTLHLIPVKLAICNSSKVGVGKDGAVIVKPCLHLMGTSGPVRGSITYKCHHAKWDVAENNCLTAPVNDLLSSAETLVSDPELNQNLPMYLERLNRTIKEQQENISTSTANLKAVVEILNLVSVIPIDAKQKPMENFLSAVDTIINSSVETWKNFKNGSSQLLDSVQKFSQSLRPVNNTIPPIIKDNLQLKGAVVGNGNVSDFSKSFTFSKLSSLSGSVLIDKGKIKFETAITIISVAYSTLGHIIPLYKTDEVINGLVISTVMNTSSQLGEDFQINMTFTKSKKSLNNPRCVFWNFSFSAGEGGWDDTGCESKENGDSVTCSCNHLTSFSILMSPSHASPWAGLTYITYIGLSISILSLLVCIAIEFAVWKSVTKTRISCMRHVCILNIAISLLIADICFITVAAMHDKNDKVDRHICTAVTFFIHFFYLCVFFWMLTLALMLFYHLVFILHNASKTTMKAVGFCLGYICPLVISAITIGITHPRDSYTQEGICLLSWKDSKALLALVIPAMTIVVINAIVTIVVIAKISRPSIGEKSISEEKSSLYRVSKSIGILTSMLGLTWGFGFATVFPESPTIFHILFTIFNAFQGLFILLCGTLWDRKVRETMLNKYSLSRWSSQHSKSISQGVSAPMLSISSPFSRTLNNLFGKAGKYEVSSTESPSLSSENTSKTYSLLS
ncbi:adhesion G protein-coupled receptor F5 isoform X2 [Varanus komodoensis]|uniref:Adhesion G protein-coupled receptor F5 n=1 Tax=Varanus komodoensis TaxID=61221 RepID=A0A8D2Q420_VARKO|nr:adhesion G protein-coupled receptor F5 isoform X2 [Varanus komodoensis]